LAVPKERLAGGNQGRASQGKGTKDTAGGNNPPRRNSIKKPIYAAGKRKKANGGKGCPEKKGRVKGAKKRSAHGPLLKVTLGRGVKRVTVLKNNYLEFFHFLRGGESVLKGGERSYADEKSSRRGKKMVKACEKKSAWEKRTPTETTTTSGLLKTARKRGTNFKKKGKKEKGKPGNPGSSEGGKRFQGHPKLKKLPRNGVKGELWGSEKMLRW